MLSNGWSWYVIALTVLNIIAMVWLLVITNKDNGIDQSDSMGHKWDGIEELNNPLPRWWLWLFIISIIFSVVYLYLYPGLGNYKGSLNWTQMSQFEDEIAQNRATQTAFFSEFSNLDIPALSQNAKAMETAERLFLNNCSTCHGSSAQGAKGFPNLTDNDWLYGGDPTTIAHSITNGRAGVMPNLALDESKVAVLAHYIKGFSGAEISDFTRERGKQLFPLCATCHGLNGEGNQALGAPSLRDDIWLHGARISDIETVLRYGKQADMPGFKDLLSGDEIRLLTAYIVSLNKTQNNHTSQ